MAHASAACHHGGSIAVASFLCVSAFGQLPVHVAVLNCEEVMWLL
jgi:hypothetical protein